MENPAPNTFQPDNTPANLPRKPETPGPGTPARSKSKGKALGWIVGVLLLLTALGGFSALYAFAGYGGGERWVKIPSVSGNSAIRSLLCDSLGTSFGDRVYSLWRLMGSDKDKAHGAYLVTPGQSPLSVARRIRNGAQTPVRLTLPGVRTMDRLANKIGETMELTPEQFLQACDTVLSKAGYIPEEYPAAFLPDTYEMYWNSSPAKTVQRLLDYRNRFWTPARLAKAKELGLTDKQVATLASIVEEETAKADEMPKVARLYINRLDKNMLLQADPTVKFATGDFALRRIRGSHLATPSAYNTYLHEGLPPGPIRVAGRKTLDAVLNAPSHDFLYMCAREDFSGYHNFAVDFATHKANARRYQQELNRRNIR